MKIKIVRVITDSIVVKWHLANTLKYTDFEIFELYVIGNNVSQYRKYFPKVTFIDVEIHRKPNPIQDFIALIKLISHIRSIKPNVVHSIMPKSGFLSAIASFIARVDNRLHTFTGQVWNLDTNYRKNIYYWCDFVISKLNTFCLTDSPSQSLFLSSHNIKNRSNDIPCLLGGSLSGVDVSSIDYSSLSKVRQKVRDEFDLGDKFTLLFLARKTSDKGAIDILDISMELKKGGFDFSLLFVGPDETESSVATKLLEAKEFGVDIINLGLVDNYRDFIAASDLLCLPSKREGFGSIIIESASLNVPAIGYDIPGLRDAIIHMKTGLLCDLGDINAFCQSIINIANSNCLYNRICVNACDRAKNEFDAILLQRELEKLYSKSD